MKGAEACSHCSTPRRAGPRAAVHSSLPERGERRSRDDSLKNSRITEESVADSEGPKSCMFCLQQTCSLSYREFPAAGPGTLRPGTLRRFHHPPFTQPMGLVVIFFVCIVSFHVNTPHRTTMAPVGSPESGHAQQEPSSTTSQVQHFCLGGGAMAQSEPVLSHASAHFGLGHMAGL